MKQREAEILKAFFRSHEHADYANCIKLLPMSQVLDFIQSMVDEEDSTEH